ESGGAPAEGGGGEPAARQGNPRTGRSDERLGAEATNGERGSGARRGRGQSPGTGLDPVAIRAERQGAEVGREGERVHPERGATTEGHGRPDTVRAEPARSRRRAARGSGPGVAPARERGQSELEPGTARHGRSPDRSLRGHVARRGLVVPALETDPLHFSTARRGAGARHQRTRRVGPRDGGRASRARRARGEQAGRNASQSLNQAILSLRDAEGAMCDKPGMQGQNGRPNPKKIGGISQQQSELNQRTRNLAQRLTEQMRLSAGDRAEMD